MKTVILALSLFSAGVILLTTGVLMVQQHIKTNQPEQGWGVLSLGLLAFLPGFYETRIAYYAWRGYDEYNFDQIPSSE